MYTTNERPQNDSRKDKSDLLCLLLSVEDMHAACQRVLNIHTRTALLLSVAIESQTLLTKLSIMEERWRHHLPFKEAEDVDFDGWSARMREMAMSLGCPDEEGSTGTPIPEYGASKFFMLDFFEALPENVSDSSHTPYYEEHDIPEFFSTLDSLSRQVSSCQAAFSDVAAQQADKAVRGGLLPLVRKGSAIREACGEILMALSRKCRDFDRMLSGEVSLSPADTQAGRFTRLADRVLNERFYNGRDAREAAQRHVINLRSITPVEEWDGLCDSEVKASIGHIAGMACGEEVVRNLTGSCELRDHDARFGQFLYRVRKTIGRQELYDLLEHLWRIRCLREDARQREEAKVASGEASPSAPKRPELPMPLFKRALARNEEAVRKYYDILHGFGNYVSRRQSAGNTAGETAGRYASWKWSHVRKAFGRLGFVDRDCVKIHFARYMSTVFPGLEASNINRAFFRTDEDGKNFDEIVTQIVDEFAPVKKIMEGQPEK